MWERSEFVGTEGSVWVPFIISNEIVKRHTGNTGHELFLPQIAVAAFYQSDFSKETHQTATLCEIGHPNEIGGMRSVFINRPRIAASELKVVNFNGWIMAT